MVKLRVITAVSRCLCRVMGLELRLERPQMGGMARMLAMFEYSSTCQRMTLGFRLGVTLTARWPRIRAVSWCHCHMMAIVLQLVLILAMWAGQMLDLFVCSSSIQSHYLRGSSWAQV